ncbi:MAG TPA: hypothetical protein VHZ52_18450 [Acidobacteriaceae bacterium]|nr:hypothetical protein [Acidobacteriaceae bacterium]
MKTKDMPHGIVGFKFAQALVDGEYNKAHEMLSPELKVEYPAMKLQLEYEDMASLFQYEPRADLEWIEVLDNCFLGNGALDVKGWAYVAIGSEAVTVTVEPFGSENFITELIWGRP